MNIDGLNVAVSSDQQLDSNAEVEFKTISAEQMEIKNDAVIPIPESGFASLYFKPDNLLYSKDSLGVERLITQDALNQDAWRFSTLTMGDPTLGYFRINTTTFASMGELGVSVTDQDNDNLTPLLGSLAGGDQVYLSNASSSNCKLINIIDSTNNTTWFSYSASLASENNTNNYQVGEEIKITFLPRGASFDQDLNTTDNVEFASVRLAGGLLTVNEELAALQRKTQNISFGATSPLATTFDNGNVVIEAGDLSSQNITPLVTNSWQLGNGGLRWQSVWTQSVRSSGVVECSNINTVSTIGTVGTASSPFTDVYSKNLYREKTGVSTLVNTELDDLQDKTQNITASGTQTNINGPLQTRNIINAAALGGVYDIGTPTEPFDDIYSRGNITGQSLNVIGGVIAGGVNLKSAIEGTVTVHVDINSAGSGDIITDAERLSIGTNTSKNEGSVTVHNDILSVGSGNIITAAERLSIGASASGKLNIDGSNAMAGPLNLNGNSLINLSNVTDAAGEVHAFVRTDVRSDVSNECTYAGVNCGNGGSANNNSGFGENALSSLASLGRGNSAFGRRAGQNIDDGCCNSTVGDSTLINATTGSFNSVLGFSTANAIITGSRNTCLGQEANVSDENAIARIALGYASLCDTDRHCVIGGTAPSNSILCIKTGRTEDCDLGATDRKFKDAHLNGSLYTPQITTRNVATVPLNLEVNQIHQNGEQISFVKTGARSDIPTGSTYAGILAGSSLGTQSTGFGSSVLRTNEGSNNTSFGYTSCVKMVGGAENTAVGGQALPEVIGGNKNVGVGYLSGQTIVGGDRNVCIGTNANVSDGLAVGRIAIGNEANCDLDRHCVIGGATVGTNAVECIKSGISETCDLGATDRKFKDAHLSGVMTVPTIETSLLQKSASGTTVIIDDTFLGTSVSPVYGGVLSGSALFVTNQYLRLTTDTLGNNGSIDYTRTAGTLGTSFLTVDFELFVNNPDTDDDGSGVSFFYGSTVPTLMNSSAGNTTISMFTYDTVGDQVVFRLASNGATQTTGAKVGTLLNEQWYPCRFTIENGNLVKGYVTDLNTPLWTDTLNVPMNATETKFGVLGACTGADASYRIRNLNISTPANPAASIDISSGDVVVNSQLTVAHGLFQKDYVHFGFENATTLTTFTAANQYQPILTSTALNVSNNFNGNGFTAAILSDPNILAEKLFLVSVSATWSIQPNAAAKLCSLAIQKNGVNVTSSVIAGKVDDSALNHPQAVHTSAIVSLTNADEIRPAVANLQDTTGVVVEYLVVTVTEL